MKAIVFHEYGSPDVLKFEDVSLPVPRFGEVRIAVHAATVNRVLDVSLRNGGGLQRGVVLPCIPGVDCAGTIDAVGPGVMRWKLGDRVAATGTMPLEPCADDDSSYDGPMGMMGIMRPGGFAEFVTVPARALIALPPALSFHTAAVAIRHVPMAWNLMCNGAKLRAGEWVLVMGASGNLGSIGIQIAKNVIGAHVIAAAGSHERAQIGLGLGADSAIDYGSSDIYDEVMRITDRRGVDVVYDNVGNPPVFARAFQTLRFGGRLVTAGAHAGSHATIDLVHLYSHGITIHGMVGRRRSDEERAVQLVSEEKIALRIDRVMPLSQAAEAHRSMESELDTGKIVLDPTLG